MLGDPGQSTWRHVEVDVEELVRVDGFLKL